MLSLGSFLNHLKRTSSSADYPGLTGNDVAYVIGDIHGRLDCLNRAHALIEQDRNDYSVEYASEIYLGDYVDRGPDSSGVIDCLLARRPYRDMVFLRGNHETMFERFLAATIRFEDWRRFGGAETLISYGLSGRQLSATDHVVRDIADVRVPVEHRDFLRSLDNYHTVGPYCFVHAGLRPRVTLEHQSIDDLTSIRHAFLDHNGSFGFIVVHGHTPVTEVDFRWNRINIDTGAFATNRLSVLKLTSTGPYLLDDIG